MKKILAMVVMLAMALIATSAMGETVNDPDDCINDGQSIVTCATIEDIKGIELDFQALNYKKIIPGIETSVEGDNIFNMTDGKPTIRNIGNTDVSIKIDATDLKNGTNIIPSSFLYVQIPGKSDKLNLGSEVTILNLVPNKPYAMIFNINAPITSKSGNYKGSISITI
jgi:hypothetical protein